GVFDDDRYWEITADYAKASPEDILVRVSLRNAGPETATIEVLPTLWFRNTWSWDDDDRRPSLRFEEREIVAEHWELGHRWLSAIGSPDAVFCDNETNASRLWGVDASTAYPKDGIGDHVVHGAPTVNPELTGTKAAFHYRLAVAPGETAVIALHLRDTPSGLGDDFADVMLARQSEADDFYSSLAPDD